MTNFLIRKFIKNYENTTSPTVRENYGKFAGIIGIISNLILCAGKIIIGAIAGSIAIIADGINNLADASSSIITLIGFRLAAMPEDEDHPYGHARIEYISGMIISVIIIVVGIELLRTSIDKVRNPAPPEFSITIIIVLLLAIAIKIWQALFNMNLGKRINSLTLMATGADSRNDVISTSAVLLSVIISKLSGFQIDGYMGCLVALFIMWSGIGLVKETISPLLGEAPDPEMVHEISETAMSFDGVLGIHDLVVHNYGPGKIFASIHIEVDAAQDVMESHDIVDNIEQKISEELHIHLTGHLDPIVVGDPLTEKLYSLVTGVISGIDGLYNVHDLRTVPGPTHTNVIFDVVIKAGAKVSPGEVKALVQEAVSAEVDNTFVVINFDNSYIKL